MLYCLLFHTRQVRNAERSPTERASEKDIAELLLKRDAETVGGMDDGIGSKWLPGGRLMVLAASGCLDGRESPSTGGRPGGPARRSASQAAMLL